MPLRASELRVARPASGARRPPRLSIVVPAFNERDNLRPFVSRLAAALAHESVGWTLFLVDDGSSDRTGEEIRAINRADPRVVGLVLSRNFGKERAIAAGLSRASGDATVILDADLQHPPEVIPALLASWRAGHEVVFAQRADRRYQGRVRRLYSTLFYRIFSRLAGLRLPPGVGDFVLLDRKAADVLRRLGETARFNKGLYTWIGFRVGLVPFTVGDRAAGASGWTLRRLFGFAVDGLVSFSSVPLRLSSVAGALVSAFAFLYAVYLVALTLLRGTDLPGFPSLIVSIMFFAGLQLVSLGIMGEYLARVFDEVKGRPLFILRDVVGKEPAALHFPERPHAHRPLRRRFRPVARRLRRDP